VSTRKQPGGNGWRENPDKLAEILRKRGLLTDAQIQRALTRQKSRGGRIGSHLLYYKFVTEEQVVQALAEQHGVPGVCLEGRRVPENVLEHLPAEVADEHQVLPIQWEPQSGLLHVAMADPNNAAAIHHARRTAPYATVKVHVAVDSILRGAIAEHYHGRARALYVDQIIELPALFAEDPPPACGPAPPAENRPAGPKVVLVSRTAFFRTFLASIFEREGLDLEVLSNPQQIAAALGRGGIEHLLVAKDLQAEFGDWVRTGMIPTPRTELSMFASVSGSLLDNPAPYKALVGALLRALQQMAELRSAASPWRPPYALVCEDLRNLGGALGFRRLAVDGLQIAAHLLLPAAEASDTRRAGEPEGTALAFADFERSLEIAQALRFPWDVEGCLVSLSCLLGQVIPARPDRPHKVSLAAQILALVWYRHVAFRGQEVPRAELQVQLRQQAARLAAPAVVETYVRLLEESGDPGRPGGGEPVLVVSDHGQVATQIGVYLRYGGFRVVEAPDPTAGWRLVQQARPRAVLVNHQRYRDSAVEFCRHVKRATGALVHAFSEEERPGLVLELLEKGFDDVHVPPFNYHVLVTRLGKSLEARAAAGGDAVAAEADGFRGTLRQLSFVDLVQALSASHRSVQVKLQHGDGERASVHLRRGQVVHAVCGARSGPEAVYRIIGWRDDGSFTTSPATTFPPDNIDLPTQTLLLEGCRLLDEARR
jgi:DNA-binding response OmpR family regulator